MAPTALPKIVLQGVSKSFKLPHQAESSIKSKVINLVRAPQTIEQRQVLDNISFEVAEGEFFGIIGRNGSGKSTLLKLLAGIYRPDSGHLAVHGVVTPFIELGVGFSPDLTGRENIFLNGALFGFDHAEVAAMYDDIVAFAELEQYMDLKLKNYSSGMQVRLAFSIAVRAETDILLIDEVLAVGDAAFQQKCFNYFYELKQMGRTIVFVSHDMDAVQRYCDRAVYVDDGQLRQAGSTQEVVKEYLLDVFQRNTDRKEGSGGSDTPARLLSCTVTPEELDSADELTLNIEYEILSATDVELRFAIVKEGMAFGHVSTRGEVLDGRPGRYRATFVLRPRDFNYGDHRLTGGLFHANSGAQYDIYPDLGSFFIRDSDVTRGGVMRIQGSWTELPTVTNLRQQA